MVLATSSSWRSDIFMTISRLFHETIITKKLHSPDTLVTHSEAESARLLMKGKMKGEI